MRHLARQSEDVGDARRQRRRKGSHQGASHAPEQEPLSQRARRQGSVLCARRAGDERRDTDVDREEGGQNDPNDGGRRSHGGDRLLTAIAEMVRGGDSQMPGEEGVGQPNTQREHLLADGRQREMPHAAPQRALGERLSRRGRRGGRAWEGT